MAAVKVQQQTGATLEVAGDADLSIFPTLGLNLGQVALEMPGEEASSLSARSLQIGVRLLPLLSKQVEIETIYLDGVAIRMVSEPAPPPVDTSKFNDEQLSRFYQEREAAIAAAGEAASANNVLAVPLALEVDHLKISDSRLELSEAGGETQVIDIASVDMRGLNLEGRPVPVKAALSLAGDDPIALDLGGSVLVNQATQVLNLENLDVKVSGALAVPVSLKLSGQVDINRQVADLNLVAKIQDTRAEGQLRYASFESPQIDTQLHLNQFTPALLALAGPEAAATQANETEQAEDEDVPLPLDAIRVMDTRANLTIDQVVCQNHGISSLFVDRPGQVKDLCTAHGLVEFAGKFY